MTQVEHKEPIQVRANLDFGFESDDIPRYWLAGDPFRSRMVDAVQATFPDGERYFIASVNAFRKDITDPALLEEVKDFSQQEGHHGRVHTDYNDRLQRQGVNVRAFTKHTQKLTNYRLKHYSASYNVALTAALEHFTAMLAELFFARKQVMAGADERVRAMLAWHAIEEMEHKAVAFDVMQKIAKVGYFKRCLAMTHATLSFMLFVMIAPWFMLKMDGLSFGGRLKAYGKGMAWMFGPRNGIFLRMVGMIAHYYRPGFHPTHLPSVHNYQAWLDGYGEEQDPMAASRAMHAAAI
jgi:predicted metal-dependent hydrolase